MTSWTSSPVKNTKQYLIGVLVFKNLIICATNVCTALHNLYSFRHKCG